MTPTSQSKLLGWARRRVRRYGCYNYITVFLYHGSAAKLTYTQWLLTLQIKQPCLQDYDVPDRSGPTEHLQIRGQSLTLDLIFQKAGSLFTIIYLIIFVFVRVCVLTIYN